MKAVVFHGIGDIRLDNVKDPGIKQPNDAIVKLTASAICGTDLHFVRGTMPGMKSGTILGHEGVGVIEQLGPGVRNFRRGERVIIPSTIACGYCSYCRAGYFAQCDNANPNGKDAGTTFYGGPETTGPFDGLQAEYARVPFANVGLVRIPEDVTDDQAILLSDIFPTGYMAAELAEIRPGNTVAVFGCGPVGQFTIASALMMGAGRVIAVDTIQSRLDMARRQGAEAVDYNREDPTQVIKEITGGIGADRVIDAVGVDANRPDSGPAIKSLKEKSKELEQVRETVAPKTNPKHGNWEPGSAPSMVLNWMIESVAKAGTMSIIGVYPETLQNFPIGQAMEKNLTVKAGNCNHRKYLPFLLEKVRTGAIDPTEILTHRGPLVGALDAYEHFDKREPGWVKVMLDPAAAPSMAA